MERSRGERGWGRLFGGRERIPDTDEIEQEDLPETEMIGSSTGMVEIYKTVSRVAPTDATAPEDAQPEDAPRDRAGSNGGSRRNSNGTQQPRSASRRPEWSGSRLR